MVVSQSRTLNTNWEESSPYNSEDKEVYTAISRRAQNAVLLNGVGYGGDGHNAASSDASNHNFRTLMLPGPVVGGHHLFEAPSNDGSARLLCLRAPPASHRV